MAVPDIRTPLPGPTAAALIARDAAAISPSYTRSYPLVEHMRAEIASGALGEITFVHGRYLCDDVLFPASGWRVDPARSGPAYVVGDLGTHWLDLAEHVTGQHVTAVLADLRSFAGGQLEDYAAVLLRFDGGAAGSLVLSAGAAGRKNPPPALPYPAQSWPPVRIEKSPAVMPERGALDWSVTMACSSRSPPRSWERT